MAAALTAKSGRGRRDARPTGARGSVEATPVSEWLTRSLPGGSPERILAGIRRHLEAGADHVRVGTIAPDFQSGVAALERLAPVLTR